MDNYLQNKEHSNFKLRHNLPLPLICLVFLLLLFGTYLLFKNKDSVNTQLSKLRNMITSGRLFNGPDRNNNGGTNAITGKSANNSPLNDKPTTIQNLIVNGGLSVAGASTLQTLDATDATFSSLTITNGPVTLPYGSISNSALSNSSLTYVAGGGLTGGGAVPLGGSATFNIGAGVGISVGKDDLSVIYGHDKNTAVQGNTSIDIVSGSNLSGGGSLTLGSGGTLNLQTVSNPSFSTSVTTPLLNLTNSGFSTSLQSATLTSNQTINLPNASGDVCLTIGNCAGLGGTISGSGTTNRIAKFNSASGIGNSSINDLASALAMTINASGNVGIGTTVPGATLDVVGTTKVTNTTLVLPAPGSSGEAQMINNSLTLAPSTNYPIAGGGFQFVYGTNNNYTISAATTATDLSRLYFTNTNNTLAYSAPAPTTQLIGSSNTVATNTASAINLIIGTNNFIFNTGSGNIATATGNSSTVYNSSTSTITNAKGGEFIIGNGGTGTITNGYGALILSAVNSGGGTFTNNYGLYIQDQSAVGSTNSYNLYSAGANSKNYFQGNVGIGTTTPTSFKLEVAGNVGPDADSTRDLGSSSKRWANIYATNIAGTVTPSGFTQGSVAFAGAGGTLTQNNAQFFWDNTNNRLGLGTTAPGYQLEVGNGAYLEGRVNLKGAQPFLRIQDTDTTPGYATNWLLQAIQGRLRFLNNDGASEPLSILTDGNVGIGTGAPPTKLTVDGVTRIRNAAATRYRSDTQVTSGGLLINSFDDTAGVYLPAFIDSSTFSIRPNGGTVAFRVASDGNVGIGTTAPTKKLEITSDQWNQLGLSDNTAGAGTVKSFLSMISTSTSAFSEWALNRNASTGVFGDAAKTTAAIYLNVANADSYIALHTAATNNVASTERLRINKDGNVGIGTTAPNKRLTISNGVSNQTSALDDTGFYLSRTLDGTYIGGITRDSTSTTNTIVLSYDTNGDQLFKRSGTTIAALSLASNGAVSGNSGNLSIPTVSQLLNLNGSANSPLTLLSDDASSGSNGIIFNRTNRTAAGNNAVAVFQYNGAELVRVATNGNVGIGITAPSTTLHVSKAGEGQLNLSNSSASQQPDWYVAVGSGSQYGQGTLNIGTGTGGGLVANRALSLASSTTTSLTLGNSSSVVVALNSASGTFTFQGTSATAVSQFLMNNNTAGSLTGTSGTQNVLLAGMTFAPTSGTAIFNDLQIAPTINQTGGANGVTRGLYINPTVTAAADFRALETVTGNVILGSTSGNVGIADSNPLNTLKVVGSLCVKNATGACAGTTSGTIYATNTTVQAADLAENYVSSQALEPGDLVIPANDGDNQAVIKSTGKYQKQLVGVVSTNPGVTLNSDARTDAAHPNLYPLALSGRVPVKVTIEGGPIQAGDYLTSSSTPGVAMKATKPGQIVGKALESFSTDGIGKVMTYVNVSFADPESALAQLTLDENGNLILPANTKIASADLGLPVIAGSNQIATSPTNSRIDNVFDANAFSEQVATSSAHLELDTKTNDLKSSILNLKSKIASLEASLNLLTSNPISNASNSAQLGLDSSTDATLSGTLSVAGRTLLADVGITGKINMGMLSINGLDDNGNATINTTSGPLKLQSDGLNSVDILAGKVIIEPSGNMKVEGEITIKKVNIDIQDVASASLGEGIIPAGKTNVKISSKAMTAKSHIFTSPDQALDFAIGVTNKKTGESFDAEISRPAEKDIKFSWWIVN